MVRMNEIAPDNDADLADDSINVVSRPNANADPRNTSALVLTPSRGPAVVPEGVDNALKHTGSARVPFMRRQRKVEPNSATKPRKQVKGSDGSFADDDGDEAAIDRSMDDPGISFIYEAKQGGAKLSRPSVQEENAPSTEFAPSDVQAPVVVPESHLKRKVNRIEKAIAEQTAWVRNKFGLDESEELLDSCSAALVQKIMLQGRLHITTSSLCFYAKIFGRVTKEQWPFSSILSVRKRRGGFFANSIKITFVDEDVQPVILASLNRREQTLALILSRLSVLSPAETTARRNSAGDESEGHSADDIYNRQGGAAFSRSRSDRSNSSTPQLSLSDHDRSRNSTDGNAGFQYPHAGSDTTSDDIPHIAPPPRNEASWEKPQATEEGQKASNISEATRAAVERLVWSKPEDAMDKVAGKEFAKRTEQARTTFDVPVVIVFNEIFLSDFAKVYHGEVKNFDLEMSEWYEGGDGTKTRDVSFRRPLGYRIGPKETRVKETQRYCFTGAGGVLVEYEGHNLDAPFGDYFRVESYFELKPADGGRGCEMAASVAVHFMKSTMLRSKIEGGTLTETKVAFTRLLDLVRTHLQESVPRELIDAFIELKLPRKKQSSRPENNGTTRSLQKRAPPEEHVAPRKAVGSGRPPLSRPPRPEPHVEHDVKVTTGRPTAPEDANKTIIQMHDTTSSHILRMVAVAALVVVCILLFLVLLSFRRMQHEFRVLEAIVREAQGSSMSRATTTTCPK